MENNERRQRTSNPTGYAGQQGTLLQTQAAYPVVSASDRFRQAPPTSAPASGSRAGSQSYGYAYEEGSQFVGPQIQPGGVPYASQEYASEQQQQQSASHQHRQQHQHQQHQHQQQYGQYGQSVLYSVPGQQQQTAVAAAAAAAAAQTAYEPVQQFQQARDSSAMEVLSAGFGVAQPQYYVPGEGGPASAPSGLPAAAPNVPSQYSSLGYTAQQAPVGRDAIAPAYSQPGMTDPHPPTAQPGYPQQQQQQQDHPPAGNEYDEFYNNYQAELKKTFELMRDGRLHEAAQSLSRLSDWLLHWAETLGLVRDDETHYPQRLKLWEEFNNCWLMTLQRQKDMTQDMVDTGQRPPLPQTLIEPDFLEKMGNQLVKNCDQIEKHGLVDYQMGVWEEEILNMLSACLDLWEQAGVGTSSSQRIVPSASSSRRR